MEMFWWMGKMKAKTKPKRSFKKVVRIYCEGITEKNYLRALIVERFKGMTVDVLPKLKNKIEVMLDAIHEDLLSAEIEDLMGLFLVLDMDVLHKDKKMPLYSRRKKELEKMMRSKQDKLHFIESRPCIEYWFLLHFVFTDKLFVNCEAVMKELKKKDRLPDYEKTDDYTQTVYRALKADINRAIQNSIKGCSKRRQHGEQNSYTCMHEMIDALDRIHKG